MLLTLIICTHNRSRYLENCINSITLPANALNLVEVIVVDNNSSDGTKDVVNEFTEYGIKYFFEEEIGLSNARNCGANAANGQWLAYVDDDVTLAENYIERAMWVINNFDFDCFGGRYIAKYLGEKPNWISSDFETMVSPRTTVGLIEKSELVGMNFLIKKQIALNLGGFNPDFGMSGNLIGYGEETYLQDEMLKFGYKLGFDPELIVFNNLLPHKLKLSWHLKSFYAHGRDGQRFSPKFEFPVLFLVCLRSMIGFFVKLPISILKLLTIKDYYWQNVVWDVISPIVYRAGQLKACKLLKSKL